MPSAFSLVGVGIFETDEFGENICSCDIMGKMKI